MEHYGRSHDNSEPVEVIASSPVGRTQPLLTPVRDAAQMKAAPVGHCLVGTTFVVWCATPELQGSIFWGALDESTVREVLAVGDFIRNPVISSRRRALTDCSAVERVEPDLLLAFSARQRNASQPWSETLERQAFVVPEGLPGMMMAGSLSSAGAAHPVRVVRSLDEAFEAIDHPLARAAHAAASAIAGEVRGSDVLLSRLRVQLRHSLDRATIESSAAALGMAPRTLQRQLAQLDTSFSDELRRVRLATAETLLVHTELKIEAIATQVGFGTASRMSQYLRRAFNRAARDAALTFSSVPVSGFAVPNPDTREASGRLHLRRV